MLNQNVLQQATPRQVVFQAQACTAIRGIMKRLDQYRSLINSLPYLFLGLIITGQLLAIYLLNGGKLLYILDDPYIHLTLARNIYQGHYGINSIEASAPSSSIIWPFILALFTSLAFFEYIPLILNIIFSLLILFLIDKIIILIFNNITNLQRIVLQLIFILISNLTPLIWTGMEHIFQILFGIIAIFGLLQLQINNRIHLLLIFSIILNPLIRYESLSISIPAIIFLYLKGYRRIAIIVLIFTILPLIIFSYFLYTLELNFFPTSIIIKSSNFSNESFLSIFLFNLSFAIEEKTWYFLFGIILAIIIRFRKNTSDIYFSTILITTILLQLIFGAFGQFARYETYMVNFSLIGFIYIYRESIIAVSKNTNYIKISSLVIFLIILLSGYIPSAIKTPFMANSIYNQQYQMARFVRDFYQKDIGVNDIGLVGYFNKNYTLDLFGLSNKKVINYRKEINNQLWMDELAEEHNVDLAMIYDSWFKTFIPSHWIKIGELYLSTPYRSPASPKVSFYLRKPEQLEQIHHLIEAFSQTLPEHAEFRFTQE